jgi:hypothetical protein
MVPQNSPSRTGAGRANLTLKLSQPGSGPAGPSRLRHRQRVSVTAVAGGRVAGPFHHGAQSLSRLHLRRLQPEPDDATCSRLSDIYKRHKLRKDGTARLRRVAVVVVWLIDGRWARRVRHGAQGGL